MRNSTTKNAIRALLLTVICLVTNIPLKAEQRISTSEADVLHDPSVLACFAHLLREAGFGFAPVERAAFVFMNADGEFRCLDWPATHQFKAAHWKGPIPVGVVAIAHTHPVASPYPSVDDRNEAVRIGMPIFVISPQIISVVQRNGREETLMCCKVWSERALIAAPPHGR